MPPQDAVGARWSAGLLVGAGSGARLAAKTLKAAENNASYEDRFSDNRCNSETQI